MLIWYFVNLLFHLSILSTCHFVNFQLVSSTCPFFNIAILSTCCLVNLLFGHFTVLSNCHFINLPFHQLANWSMRYSQNVIFVMLTIYSSCCSVLSSRFFINFLLCNLLFSQLAVSSTCHLVNLMLSWFSISSNLRFY